MTDSTDMLKTYCAKCLGPIDAANNIGHLRILDAEVRAAGELLAEYWDREKEKADAANTNGMIYTYSVHALLSIPQRAKWRFEHYRCCVCATPAAEAQYSIELDRDFTAVELVDWAAHMFDKSWITDTDWGDMLQSVALWNRTTDPVVPRPPKSGR